MQSAASGRRMGCGVRPRLTWTSGRGNLRPPWPSSVRVRPGCCWQMPSGSAKRCRPGSSWPSSAPGGWRIVPWCWRRRRYAAQWADELRSRFGLPAQVLDLRALLDLELTGPAGINPWRRLPIVISSIDFVKRAEVRASVEDAPIDLLIVDEAHHATPGTDRHAVVSRLARQAAWVLLVSATPHSGDAASYQALLEIGGGEASSPLRIFRRTESHVAALVPRRTRIWLVRASAAEARLYEGVLAYTRRLCKVSPAAAGAQLFASLLARRAASSARAARLTLERRLDWLSGEIDSELPGRSHCPGKKWRQMNQPHPG